MSTDLVHLSLAVSDAARELGSTLDPDDARAALLALGHVWHHRAPLACRVLSEVLAAAEVEVEEPAVSPT